MSALGQVVNVREGALPISPNADLLFVDEISPAAFELGPVVRAIHGGGGGSAASLLSVYPWIAALPAAQALLAGETALALIRGRRSPLARSARLNVRLARRGGEFGPAPGSPGWIELAVGVMQAARAALPDVVAALPATRNEPALAAPLLARLTEWVRRWWRLVMRRLAFADVTRASITVKRTARGVVVRPAILGQLGQLVRVTDGAPSVRELSQPAIATAERLSTAEFEAGPVAWSDPRFARLLLSTLLQTDSQWPWTARPWVAALPLGQALIAAETALAMLPRRGGPRLTPARRRATGQSVARDRFKLARRQAQEIAAILRLKERVAKARLRVRAGSKEGISLMQRSFGMSGTLRFRQGEFYDSIGEIIGQVAAVIVPFAVADTEGVEVAKNRRTDFYQRWWRLVMRRLAFTDVRTATLSVRRTPRGVIVRPAILGQLAGGHDVDRAMLASCFEGRP